MSVTTDETTHDEVVEDDEPGNGSSIEDRVNAGENEEAEEEDGQFTIPGTRDAMSTTAGGRRPGFSEAKLASIPLKISGEFRKEERVRLLVDCIVQDVHFPDEYKGTQIVRTRRVHVMKPVAVEPIEIPPVE